MGEPQAINLQGTPRSHCAHVTRGWRLKRTYLIHILKVFFDKNYSKEFISIGLQWHPAIAITHEPRISYCGCMLALSACTYYEKSRKPASLILYRCYYKIDHSHSNRSSHSDGCKSVASMRCAKVWGFVTRSLKKLLSVPNQEGRWLPLHCDHRAK